MLKKVFIFFIAICSSALFAQSDNCDLKRDSDGIKVYTCKTENEKFKLLRAEFELKGITPSQLKSFIWDVPNYTTWQYNMIESEKLSTDSENEMSYRSVVDAPWPVENRELILKVRLEPSEENIKVYIQSFDYDKPVPKDLVRVPFFDASWNIIPTENSLKVTYTLKIDPGGSVPAWLANLAMADGPFVSFKKLKERLEKK